MAVLYFRGLPCGRERRAVLRRFSELQEAAAERAGGAGGPRLFTDLQPQGGPGWRAQLPFSCLRPAGPHS